MTGPSHTEFILTLLSPPPPPPHSPYFFSTVSIVTPKINYPFLFVVLLREQEISGGLSGL